MKNQSNNVCEHLIQLDREFDLSTAEKGAVGWVAYFAEDGIMVGSSIVNGKKAILEEMEKAFNIPDFSLRWEPLDCCISDDGSLGYTYGQYVRKYRDDKGDMQTSKGTYTTIWKLQSDGKYKIIHDIGN